MEYSFIFTSKFTHDEKDDYLLHILRDGQIIDSCFVQFPEGTAEQVLVEYALNKIQVLEAELNG